MSKGTFVVFRGYIDESFDNAQRFFALSCVTGSGKHWLEMERIWKLHLASVNRKLKKQGRPLISRYHASDTSGRRGDFSGWTRDERDEFVRGLLGIFKRIPLHTVALDANLDDLCEVFPEATADRLKAAYFIMTVALIQSLAEDYFGMSHGRPVKITLFHERTAKYDSTILQAFNRTVLAPNFVPYRSYFTTITPVSWENCIALQPADLLAFEAFKESEGREEARQIRKSLGALMKMEDFGIHSRRFPKAGMQELKKEMERDGTKIVPW
ncbi:MAG: hypothetical protein WA182_21685 [Candidatus Sulfotelmatobacter sp.]